MSEQKGEEEEEVASREGGVEREREREKACGSAFVIKIDSFDDAASAPPRSLVSSSALPVSNSTRASSHPVEKALVSGRH